MSRGKRIYSDIGIYHIVFRGVNKQPIFQDKFDFQVMIKYLEKVKKFIPHALYAYCFMTNHVHLLIKENEMGDISQIMKRLLTKYALYYNNKYERSGHLFETRYKSKAILSNDHLIASFRYIHLNPVKAEICEYAKQYEWSSYNEYAGNFDGLADKTYIFNIVDLPQIKKMHQLSDDVFDPFNQSVMKLNLLRKDIRENFNIEPGIISQLPLSERKEIIKKLKEKHSYSTIETLTGIKKRTIINYK